MSNKTIIFDVDGTAIDSPRHQLPSARLMAAIHNVNKSHSLCAATGRVWSFAAPMLKAMDLQDPCVVAAGTQIRDPRTGEVLWQRDIELTAVQQITDVIDPTDKNYKILYNDYDADTYFNNAGMPTEGLLGKPVYFLGLIFVPKSNARAVMKNFAHIRGIACTLSASQIPDHHDILITNENATKEHAVYELLKLLSVDQTTTTGIGDGHNDIALLRAVHHKVAMGNAIPELKAMADLVIDSVEDDGLAEYLESLS